jgi:hypothetical protein
MILHVLIVMVAGWLQRHQQQTLAYLLEENRVLKARLSGRRLRFTDTERRRFAALAHPVWSNYSNAPFRQQLYTIPCAFLVLHSTMPCLIFTVSRRGTRGGGTAARIGRRY